MEYKYQKFKNIACKYIAMLGRTFSDIYKYLIGSHLYSLRPTCKIRHKSI